MQVGDPEINEIVGVLEVVASERLDLLLPLLELLRNSPAYKAVNDLARCWYVEPTELPGVAERATRHLDRLEARRRRWRHPSEIVRSPNVHALWSFAAARRTRVPGMARSRRLTVLSVKLRRIAEIDHQRRKLDAFLKEPNTPVDPGWLDAFLSPDHTA